MNHQVSLTQIPEPITPGFKISSGLNTEGFLRISLVRADGSTEVFSEENLIVALGRRRVLSSLYANPYSTGPIASLRVGVGGCIDPEGKFPKVPTLAQTALYSQVLSLPVSYTVSDAGDSVTFVADVDQSQCNSLRVSEAGLFYADNGMFNIKTFPGIPKSEEFGIHFEWTIRVY